MSRPSWSFLVLLLLFLFDHCRPETFIVKKYRYGVAITLEINNAIEYIFEHDETQFLNDSDYPAKVSVSSKNASRKFPIFVTARQQKGILSWQLPVIIDNKEVAELSRTLCPNKNYFIGDKTNDSTQNQPIIHVYSSSLVNISFTLNIDLAREFFLLLDDDHSTTVSPSAPQVFFYSFKNDINITSTNSLGNNVLDRGKSTKVAEQRAEIMTEDKVIIRFDSDDDYCMLVSIQNASCPIFDTENDIMFEGFYETVSRRGGITVSKNRFPLGFYIVLVVKTTDIDCSGYSSAQNVSHFTNFFDPESQDFDPPADGSFNNLNDLRFKNVKISIKPSISIGEYWLASMSAVIAIIIVYIIFLSGLFCYKYKPMALDEIDQQNTESTISPGSPINNPEIVIEDNALISPESDEVPNTIPSTPVLCTVNNTINSRTSSLTTLANPELYGKIYLNQLCTRGTKDIKRQSGLYLWHLVTIAIFYGLPVIQLVITYQRVLNQTGNQDLCYYNFLCAHSVGLLSDFNHVFSNLGYVLLGALFIFFTWKKHKQYQDAAFEQNYGIPPHHGLFYAMGVALMMEGVLSASYHVCPNHSNFQFDTSFMYIMAVLCMVKIYQTRHPDINARAHTTFSLLAGAILICLFGVLYPNFYFWLFFTILHIGLCLLLTFQIYYMGQWEFRFCCCTDYKCKDICKPIYRSRCILVLIANLCNLGLAIFGLYNHSKDFATHLLYVFLMNLALHLAFYITMKVANGERPPIYTWLLLVVAIITWGASLFFFFSPSTSWALTPAQSRGYNMPCALLKFYDHHDIWHFLSAAAMFFSFMLLLTLDDDIMNKPHSQIPVF